MNDLFLPNVIVIQPVVPSYRKSFFNAVAKSLGQGFCVYSSDMNMGALTKGADIEPWQKPLGRMKSLGSAMAWQRGALSIPISRGDVVVISGAPRCLSNMILLMKARLNGARTIWWGQLWSGTTRWHRFVLRLVLMRLAHTVMFYTDAEVADYKARYGWFDRRLLGALNNGIDVKPIQKRRTPYEIAERSNAILFVGRLTDKANLMLLLKSLTHPTLGDATLHVVGDGGDRAVLQEWSRENGIGDRVIWHGGTVEEDEIAPIANRCAVFCYPGGVGLSLVHAMAYGLPTVVHDDRTTHMPEIAAFEDGVTGAKFQKDNAISLAETLANLLAEPETCQRMSAEGLRRADTMYNTDVMAARFVSFISMAAGSPEE